MVQLSDTDSFQYQFFGKDPESIELAYMDRFDTSCYPEDHPCYNPASRSISGRFADVYENRKIADFVGLRSKLYAVKLVDDGEKVAAKGLKISYMWQNLMHAMYEDCLTKQAVHLCQFLSIRSFKQNLKTVEDRKTALSPYDDKRYLMDDGCRSLAYGHKSIPYLRIDYETTSGPPLPAPVVPCISDLPDYELALDGHGDQVLYCSLDMECE